MTNALQHLNLSHEEYYGQDQIRAGDGTGLSISHIGSHGVHGLVFRFRRLWASYPEVLFGY
jgi:hypothetical protein